MKNVNLLALGAFMLPVSFAHAQIQATPDTAKITASKDIAGSISSTVKGKTSNASRLNESQIRPVSGENNMKTYDGKTAFDGKAVCKGSSEFMRMLVQPTTNGNLKLLNIMQDTDMNGSLDITTSPGWDISVVCSNGFQTCSDANNAATCTSWAWVADPKSYQLGRKNVAMTELGGCYCINNSCGSNLAWNNLGQILNDLGGGASQALSRANPWFTLSQIKVDGVSASFVGGDTASCSIGDSEGFFGTADGKKILSYKDNYNAMKTDANSQKTTSDAYRMITEGSLNPNETSDVYSCDITRNVNLDEPKLNEIIAFDGGQGSVQQCGTDCLQLVLGRLGDNYWSGTCKYFEVDSNFFIKDHTRIASATLINAVFDDWMQLWAGDKVVWSGPYGNWNDAGPVPGACELNKSWNQSPNTDFKQYLDKNGPVKFKIRVEVSGEGEGYALVRLKADLSCREGDEYVSNTCTAYEQDQNCQLVDETVDGVKTFTGSINTGLIPLPQTQVLQGSFCSVAVKRDWFKKKRQYRCNRKTDFNFDKIIERKAYIDKTVTPGDYKDKMFNNGKVSYGAGELFWPDMPKVGDCINMCKTRKPKQTPDMAVSGQVDKNNKMGVIKYDNFYYECDATNKCPAEPGEEVIKACQCLNEFAEASAIMQVIRQAGQDMICSSGNPKKPDGSSK
ncbi:TPA: conjugal transfer protein TraN [Escherichia coli]|uniref:Conjugal transfer protein TraN n=1 Tax=Salmonella enterica TaxID=28901 RepID=A0A5Z3BRQ8_SALER|nr:MULTISPECIES: conjugal transfer protein TraN [Enterobacteriaceae]EBZ0757959.1 conjugal transfer protein TraN [Salmonella enterica subsp. enterica serovar Enteritidis]ECR6709254.1 conjugal transfer protein TraN [Salmonella enterica]EDE8091399.1 conjugal transfer protein TraN [Salmonella enterica subsp. enterica serovar Anecho]EDU7438880.1 conjugal transfer protein TraN [Salmonella enterica subsp. enterica]EDY6680789.1 conjugal transfer protein TraN [Salmonella enterica subsp. enterica serova